MGGAGPSRGRSGTELEEERSQAPKRVGQSCSQVGERGAERRWHKAGDEEVGEEQGVSGKGETEVGMEQERGAGSGGVGWIWGKAGEELGEAGPGEIA